MIKLSFSNFRIKTNGIVSHAKIIATIKLFDGHKWFNITYKEFKTKITLKPNEVSDLNKAYKYIQASLEKKAYNWAYKIVDKESKNQLNIYNQMLDFTNKAKHIVEHNTEYLKDF